MSILGRPNIPCTQTNNFNWLQSYNGKKNRRRLRNLFNKKIVNYAKVTDLFLTSLFRIHPRAAQSIGSQVHNLHTNTQQVQTNQTELFDLLFANAEHQNFGYAVLSD